MLNVPFRALVFSRAAVSFALMSASETTGDPTAIPSSSETHAPRSAFVTTHWSVVLSARDKDNSRSAEALEKLCRSYWYPLYVYVRRQGHSAHDAQDLTQEFFARLLEKDYLRAAAREKGKFRTFLLVALKRFLANEWDRARAQKRGGGRVPLALDTAVAERRYQIEPGTSEPADRIYDRRWALTMLENSMARLRGEFVASGRAEDFERLKIFLTAERGEICTPPLPRNWARAKARRAWPSTACANGSANCSAKKLPTRSPLRKNSRKRSVI